VRVKLEIEFEAEPKWVEKKGLVQAAREAGYSACNALMNMECVEGGSVKGVALVFNDGVLAREVVKL
jgi:hypothetical protein